MQQAPLLLLLLVCGLASAAPITPYIRVELKAGSNACTGATQSISVFTGDNFDECQFTGTDYVAFECDANGDLLRYSCGSNSTCQGCQFDINMSECVNGNAIYKCLADAKIEDVRGYDGNPLEAQYSGTESCEFASPKLQSVTSWKAGNCQGTGINYSCENGVYTYTQYSGGVCQGTPTFAIDIGTNGCASQSAGTSYIRTCVPQQVFPIVTTYLKVELSAGSNDCTGATQSVALINAKNFAKCQYNGTNYIGYECNLENNLIRYNCGSNSSCQDCELDLDMSTCVNGNAKYTCVWEPKIEEVDGLDGNPLEAHYNGNDCEFDYPALQSLISWKPANCQTTGVHFSCENSTYTFSQYSSGLCQGTPLFETDIDTQGCSSQPSSASSEIRTCDPAYFPAYSN